MQVCRIQPEIETALQEVARGREREKKKKECHVSHSAKQRKRSVYGGWEREIKTTDRPPAKRHKTLRHHAEADAAATKGAEQKHQRVFALHQLLHPQIFMAVFC